MFFVSFDETFSPLRSAEFKDVTILVGGEVKSLPDAEPETPLDSGISGIVLWPMEPLDAKRRDEGRKPGGRLLSRPPLRPLSESSEDITSGPKIPTQASNLFGAR
jgi:hypothetical protein